MPRKSGQKKAWAFIDWALVLIHRLTVRTSMDESFRRPRHTAHTKEKKSEEKA